MDFLSVFNPLWLLILSLSFFFLSLFFFPLFSPFLLFFWYGYMWGFNWFIPPLFLLVNTSPSIIVTTGLSALRWTLMISLNSWSILMSQIFNGYWNGGTFQAWSTKSSRITVFFRLGFIVALTTLHVALQGNLVTIKELLVIMVPSIPWHLLRGS